VWASGILGTYKEIKINALLDYETCLAMGYDVPAVYENVISDIPEELLVAMKDDQYIIFTDSTGKRGFLGMSWIKPESMVEITDSETIVTVKGSDVSKIKLALSYAGLTVKNVQVNTASTDQ